MNNKVLSLLILSVFMIMTAFSDDPYRKNNPAGKWKFDAPDAPYNYNTGIFDVSRTENNYSVAIVFANINYKITGQKVKFESNTLSFNISVEGEHVSLNLKMVSPEKMSGKATYSEGEISVALVRQPEK